MFCVNCGNEIDESVKFCPNCGHACSHEGNEVTNENVQNTVTQEDVNVDTNVNNTINGNVNNSTSVEENVYDCPTKGLSAGSLILPPLGLAYYFLSKKDFPNKAHGALEASIFGLVAYTLAAVMFIFIVLPVEKQYIVKYECEKGNIGAVYDKTTQTCKRADGSEYKTIIK